MSAPFVLSYVALWIVVLLMGLLILGLSRALHDLRQQGQGASAGSWRGRQIPAFSAVDLSGQQISTSSLAGEALVLLFVAPNCPACKITPAEVQVLAKDPNRRLVVVARTDQRDSRSFARKHELTASVVPDEDGRLFELFDIDSPPTAVRVRADGTIESYGAPGVDEDEDTAQPAVAS